MSDKSAVADVVRAGYARHRTATASETYRLESAREAERIACSRYTRLRAAVLDYLHNEGHEAGGPYRTRLRSEVGRGE